VFKGLNSHHNHLVNLFSYRRKVQNNTKNCHMLLH